MTLAEMSIDEATALACREVPECAPKQVAAMILSCDMHYVGDVLPRCDAYRSVWLDAARVWLVLFGDGSEFFRPWSYTTGWAVDKVTYLGGGLESVDDTGLKPPTKYHAFAAAVLLAAGKTVP